MKPYRYILEALIQKKKGIQANHCTTRQPPMLTISYEIGKVIMQLEEEQGWGAKVVEKLSLDLHLEFKDMIGLSPRNLRYMRDFFLAYPHFPFLQASLQNHRSYDEILSKNEIQQICDTVCEQAISAIQTKLGLL